MYLVGSRAQHVHHHIYDASGTITNGGTAQLVLPRQYSRSVLIFSNDSTTADMYIEIGYARASATLSGGSVASCSVTNAGFGYSRPPIITFLSGNFGQPGVLAPTYTLPGTADMSSPNSPAQAHCVMTGSAGSMTVSSIVIDNPGSGYLYPPLVFLGNDALDPFGSAVPSLGGGIYLPAKSPPLIFNGTACPTDPVSVFCATSSAPFTCKYMN